MMGDATLTNSDFTESDEPFRLFGQWLDDATSGEPNDPNGVALATVDPDGLPNVRMVLLKGFDARGFVFYTNFESAKGREILASRKAAMCFHWKSLRRQVRVRGPVEIVSDAEADAILRDAAARQPHRRLGFQAVQAAGKPFRAGEGCRRIHRQIRDRHHPATGPLVRLPHRAHGHRVLARQAVPAARPARLHARRRR